MSKIITIDGPVSSGKNSVGALLAKKLGYQFIDTGSIYRIYTLFILEKNYLSSDLEKIDIQFKTMTDDTSIFADGLRVDNRLHEPKVTANVSKVAANPEIRAISKKFQRQIGETLDTVMTGRDIGSEIFPDANLKIFLTATPEVRAERRFKQLKLVNPEVSFNQVLNQIKVRDKMDSERKASPMRIPEDAIIIDNSYLTVDETVDKILKYYK